MIATISVLVVAAMAGYTIKISKATSYLSSDPRACINCHVMNTQYATWQHSSHKDVGCVECHLPTDDIVEKYKAKAIDGFNHSLAFTLGNYDPAIKISDYGAERVQKNCISCHDGLTSEIRNNYHRNHPFKDEPMHQRQKCWECHKSVPHGKVRATTTTPFNLGVK